MATVTHQDIYKEAWDYLTKLFLCPVVQGYQNNSPLPDDCIVMTILFERDLDYSSNYYDEVGETGLGTVAIQKSVEVTMQLDFYGSQAPTRARHIANIWQNEVSTQLFKNCQPLYSKQPTQLQYINEKNQYEHRWMVEVLLQYNPEFIHDQEFLGLPTLTMEKV